MRSPRRAQRAQQMYAEGAAIVAIRAATGLTKKKLYWWLKGVA